MRAGVSGAALGHSNGLSRQRRTRFSSTASHSLPRAVHRRQLRGPNRRPCGQAAANIAFSRVGLVVLATSRDAPHDGFGLRSLWWDGQWRRASNGFLARPPIGRTAVHRSAGLSLLNRARFSSAILGAAFGGHSCSSRAGANRRPCGLAPITTTSDHSAKLPWAQATEF